MTKTAMKKAVQKVQKTTETDEGKEKSPMKAPPVKKSQMKAPPVKKHMRATIFIENKNEKAILPTEQKGILTGGLKLPRINKKTSPNMARPTDAEVLHLQLVGPPESAFTAISILVIAPGLTSPLNQVMVWCKSDMGQVWQS